MLLRALWTGNVPLARAFWEFAILYGLVLNAIASVAALSILAQPEPPTALGMIVFLCPLPYNVLATVAVWRSAGRYEGQRLWADLARAAVLVWAIMLSLL